VTVRVIASMSASRHFNRPLGNVTASGVRPAFRHRIQV
jgi:hypothetical protein